MGNLIAERSAELAITLTAYGARFVVVGSTARRLRGCDLCPGDLDVVVVPGELSGLAGALHEVGVTFARRFGRVGPVTVTTPWCPLDVFVADTHPAAGTTTVAGVPLVVARV